MSITVNEALKLDHLLSLEVIAGKNGFHNKIEKIGILDHEIVEGIRGHFRSGDFVLTTLTPIRDDMEAIKRCIIDLVDCAIAALAIKTIYVKSLPEEIIQYADQYGVPILFFDEKTYFEDIIEDLLKGLASKSHLELIEGKISTLFSNNLKSELVEEMAYDLCSNFMNTHQVFFLKEKRYINSERHVEIAQRYQRSRKRPIEHAIFKYKEGLIMVLTYEKPPKHVDVDRDYLLGILNLSSKDYYIGMGRLRSSLQAFDQSIKEAIYACQVCEINLSDHCHYDEIGIYKMLLPHKNQWMKEYVKDVIQPIVSYDDGKLIQTARMYVQYQGDILKTAENLFQHKNTIRYRIQKMKALLNTTSDSEFYEMLSVAIKCEKLL